MVAIHSDNDRSVASGWDTCTYRDAASMAVGRAQTSRALSPQERRPAGNPLAFTRVMPASGRLSPPRVAAAQTTHVAGIAITTARSSGKSSVGSQPDDRISIKVRPTDRKNPWIARWIPRLSGPTSVGRPAAASSSRLVRQRGERTRTPSAGRA